MLVGECQSLGAATGSGSASVASSVFFLTRPVKEHLMKGFVDNIEQLTLDNVDFRRVLYTGKHLQRVLMTVQPGEAIGGEVHAGHDQCFRIESGQGKVLIDGTRRALHEDDAIIVPAGARHNISNTGDAPLRRYTIYSPPNHRDGVVHATRADVGKEHFDGVPSE
ncbi:MAG: cupin domain-containing protein [Pseudoxanthomonas sp.]|nr:cupin domain-containing protein [Pseudoxanthomonas sp.]